MGKGIIVGLVLSACAMPESRALTYLAIGDSVTAGTNAGGRSFSWATGERLDASFASQIEADEAWNVSFPGTVSDSLWLYQVRQAEVKKAEVVSLLVGTNDLCWGLGHRVVSNVKKIVKHLSAKEHVQAIVVGTLPDLEQVYQIGKTRPYCSLFRVLCPSYFLKNDAAERAQMRQQISNINEEIKKLPADFPKAKVVTQIGEQVYETEDISTDCFHPTKKGQQRIADAFAEVYSN